MRSIRVIARGCLSLLLFVLLFTVSGVLLARVSLDEAVESVRNQHNGRVLSAETQRQNGAVIHVIKLLNNKGRVKQIRIDSADGRHISPKKRK